MSEALLVQSRDAALLVVRKHSFANRDPEVRQHCRTLLGAVKRDAPELANAAAFSIAARSAIPELRDALVYFRLFG